MGNRQSLRWAKRHAAKVPQAKAKVVDGEFKGYPDSYFLDRGPHSKYVWWVGNNAYMMYRYTDLIEKVGGTYIGNSGVWTIKGMVMAASLFALPQSGDYKICYMAHGTSNKGQGAVWGPQGRSRYDFYHLMGPKMAWAYKKYGHYLGGGRGVKIGNVVADPYIKDQAGCIGRARALLGITDTKPILLFAPTYNTHSYNRASLNLRQFTPDYHVVMTVHPRERIVDGALDQLSFAKIFRGNVHDILYGADMLIADSGSIVYDFLITGRPILLVKPLVSLDFWDKWDVYEVAPSYDPEKENVYVRFKEALDTDGGKYQKLYERCFYYPFKGGAVERAAGWVRDQVEALWLRGSTHNARRGKGPEIRKPEAVRNGQGENAP